MSQERETRWVGNIKDPARFPLSKEHAELLTGRTVGPPLWNGHEYTQAQLKDQGLVGVYEQDKGDGEFVEQVLRWWVDKRYGDRAQSEGWALRVHEDGRIRICGTGGGGLCGIRDATEHVARMVVLTGSRFHALALYLSGRKAASVWIPRWLLSKET